MDKKYSPALFERPGVSFRTDIPDPKERIQAYIDTYRNEHYDGFDEALMSKHIRLISATGPPHKVTSVYELEAVPIFCSRMNNMHGGAVALIYDMCTTMAAAPLSTEGFWKFGGVSRGLNVTFLRPVKVGTRVRVECEVLQIGRRLATIRGEMRDKESGALLSVAEHNKASIELGALAKA